MGRYVSTKTVQINPGISYTKEVYGTGNYRVFYTSKAWTVPPGVTRVRATLLGAGGGPGGTFVATQLVQSWCCSGSNFTAICATNCCRIAQNVGGSGAGGSFTVATASVTPGCTCCIVVGSGGACGADSTCWATGNASAGGNGGFTCAFGFCAGGGAGGTGGYCVPGACNSPASWGTVTVSGCAAGGTANGNVFSISGNYGSRTYGCQTNLYASGTYNTTDVFGGASGTPLGCDTTISTTTPWCIANPLNSLSFDGSCAIECCLLTLYNVPRPRWPGQNIYTQVPFAGNAGSIGSRNYWESTTLACNYCTYTGYYFCQVISSKAGTFCITCSSSQGGVASNVGCGAGGTPKNYAITCLGCQSINNCFAWIQNSARAGGNGMAVIEW